MNERIFISYKRVDKDRVFALKDGIEQATRAKCWIDLDGIESNAQFAAKIMTAIDRCEVFLFMRSKEHNQITDLEKDWTYRELNYALSQEKNIVFINLDNSPIPNWVTFIFPHKQEVDSAAPGKILRLHNDLKNWLGTAEEPVHQPKEEEKPAQIDKEFIKKVWQEMTDEEIEIDEYTFKKDPDHFGLQLVKTDQTISNAIIPNTIPYNGTGLPVTSIGKDAFHSCSSLKSITIPNSVTRINWYAFRDCSSLISITIPYSVTSIGQSAFSGCSSLTFITIPNSVTSIGSTAFYDCSSLTSITIPNSVTSIGDLAFDGCSSLDTITCLAMTPPALGLDVFYGCDNATLLVPCEALVDYEVHKEWGQFTDIECISSEEAETEEVVIESGSTTVIITWPTEEGADTYTIVIKKDGEVVCTLTFNAEGQLLNIAFAPGRDGNHPAQYAEAVANGKGYRFTVTGLEEGTDYTYTVTSKDAANKTIKSHTGEFTTESLTAVENTHSPSPMTNCQKLLRDGQLLILRDGKTYTAMGAEIL